jgi:hypothetical protein
MECLIWHLVGLFAMILPETQHPENPDRSTPDAGEIATQFDLTKKPPVNITQTKAAFGSINIFKGQ